MRPGYVECLSSVDVRPTRAKNRNTYSFSAFLITNIYVSRPFLLPSLMALGTGSDSSSIDLSSPPFIVLFIVAGLFCFGMVSTVIWRRRHPSYPAEPLPMPSSGTPNPATRPVLFDYVAERPTEAGWSRIMPLSVLSLPHPTSILHTLRLRKAEPKLQVAVAIALPSQNADERVEYAIGISHG